MAGFILALINLIWQVAGLVANYIVGAALLNLALGWNLPTPIEIRVKGDV